MIKQLELSSIETSADLLFKRISDLIHRGWKVTKSKKKYCVKSKLDIYYYTNKFVRRQLTHDYFDYLDYGRKPTIFNVRITRSDDISMENFYFSSYVLALDFIVERIIYTYLSPCLEIELYERVCFKVGSKYVSKLTQLGMMLLRLINMYASNMSENTFESKVSEIDGYLKEINEFIRYDLKGIPVCNLRFIPLADSYDYNTINEECGEQIKPIKIKGKQSPVLG